MPGGRTTRVSWVQQLTVIVLPAAHAHTGELLQIPKLSAVRVPDEPRWFVPVNTAYLM